MSTWALSGFLGQQVSPLHPLPLRTSLQSSENDEAAQAASSVFLNYNDTTAEFGGRSATALHLAWYAGGLSFEAEWQGGRDHLHPPRVEDAAVGPCQRQPLHARLLPDRRDGEPARAGQPASSLRSDPRFLGTGSHRGLRPLQRSSAWATRSSPADLPTRTV